ncbi:MAG TPA: type II secretion system F family protein [Bryobacteraceae bacterium]|nr:type II secretion system F family protein [Bryobacteraceae bacterium]
MILFVLLTACCWMAIALGWWLWSRARRKSDLDRVKARLTGVVEAVPKPAHGGASLIQSEDVTTGRMVLKLLGRLNLNERLKAAIEQAGLRWNTARAIHGCLALFLVAFTAVWYLAPQYREAAPLAALLAGTLPVLYVFKKRAARLHDFEEQFPEVLEFLSRAMRAGHAFSVSLEMIHAEFKEPVAGEFKRAFDEQNLGMPLDAALTKMGERVPSMDVHFFVSAVLLQKRTGGNLAELLDKLAYLIRERFKLRGRIRAISAHGRMTGTVLSLIPLVVGAMMCWVNPDYKRFFMQDELGKTLIGAAVGLQLLGYGIIRKIVSIEV